MKVAGMKMTDPWASRVLRNKSVRTELVSGAPVETVVHMDRVAIEHHGPEKNYRPLLHLTGELLAIRPSESLPHGVEEVTFRSGLGPTVDAFYEFDDPQLGQLVGKGYFTEGFEAPSSMAGIDWELPTTIDALILAPEHDGDTPVVFVTVHGQTELALDIENSGYDLAEYFENHLTAEADQERALNSAEQEVPTHAGVINDLFAAEEFALPDAVAQRVPGLGAQSAGDYPVVRASIFEDLMAEFEEKIPAVSEAPVNTAVETEEQPVVPVDHSPDAAETLYRERIVPGVAKALARPAERVPETEVSAIEEAVAVTSGTAAAAVADAGPDLLDLFEEDDELDVAPVATAPAVEQVWEPDADSTASPEAGAGTEDGDRQSDGTLGESGQRRRVQRAQAHERALELDRATSDEPELG
jgi:hypothetical protein